MTIVNQAAVEDILSPLSGMADIDEDMELYGDVDPEDQDTVRGIIRALIVPYFHANSPEGQAASKLGLAWYLTFRPDRLERVYESQLPPFRDQPTRLWEMIWEELFFDEDYHLTEDASSFEVVYDPHTVMVTRARHHGAMLGPEWDHPPPLGRNYPRSRWSWLWRSP